MSRDLDFAVRETAHGHELFRTDSRNKRLVWLKAQFPQDDLYLFQDGRLSRLIFQEALACFEDGHFIAVLALAFSFVERSLAGRFFEIGRTKLAREKGEALIRAAVKQSWLTEAEASHLNRMRSLRNSVVHFRDPLDLDRPEVRAILAAKGAAAQLESDARALISAAIHVLSKTAL